MENVKRVEYIEREAAFANIAALKISGGHPHTDALFNAGIDVAEKVMRSVPPADVAPVRHGRWVKIGSKRMNGPFRCVGKDGCGVCSPHVSKHCPACGCLMDLPNEQEGAE